ncbi:phosphotransferase family protein [Paenibacillus lautus]|uniref:phosphotransferase family protein n=1 Tax=Paenibacillus lautus TaxID=1401 RepID=UPI001C0F914A|nr:aminoglycoside phosphotransferase family protein [Paenibacillus lautus]MBU5345914.1 aminoglycoside phosphotransferase family protein [Paenibacillus lautus]
MKEGWERTVPPMQLDITQIHDMIAPVFHRKKVVAAERIGTGLSNTNYKIRLEGSAEPYVLRLFRKGHEIAEKELAIIQRVRQTVPVADYIYADTSCRVFDKPWALMEWKEGNLLRDVMQGGSEQDLIAAAASAGRILANIHKYTFTESGFFSGDMEVQDPIRMDGERFLAFIEQSLFQDPCGQWLGEELAQSVWSFSQTYSHLLSEIEDTPVLVHSDYNGLNILMQHGPEGCAVSAVLDWEEAFSWNRYVDIANMLRYEPDGSVFEKNFVRAYREEGAVLNDHWRILSKLEDLVALCDMLTHSNLATPTRMRDLQRLIAETVQVTNG